MTQRPGNHYHPDYWSKTDQHRFEDRVTEELKEIRAELATLATRVLLMAGGIAILAFLIPLVIPIVRDWLSIPPTLQ